MIRALRRTLILAATLLSVSACGQSSLAKHNEAAEATLAQVGAPDFENASTPEYAAIRHAPSGMTCRLPQNGVFEFGVFPASARNAGAHCASAEGEVVSTFIVVRFPPPTTIDTAFQEALAATAGRAGAQLWDGEPSEADKSSPEGLTHFRIQRFVGNVDGAPRYLRVAMTEADGWFVQQVVSAPAGDAETVEEQAGEAWRSMLREFAAAHAEEG